jgi:hypothetical protein
MISFYVCKFGPGNLDKPVCMAYGIYSSFYSCPASFSQCYDSYICIVHFLFHFTWAHTIPTVAVIAPGLKVGDQFPDTSSLQVC